MFSPLTVGRGDPGSWGGATPAPRKTLPGRAWSHGLSLWLVWAHSGTPAGKAAPSAAASLDLGRWHRPRYRPDKITGGKQPAELRLLGFILHINVVTAAFSLF